MCIDSIINLIVTLLFILVVVVVEIKIVRGNRLFIEQMKKDVKRILIERDFTELY